MLDFNLFAGLLKMNDVLQKVKELENTKYVIDNEIINKLIGKYKIDEIAGSGLETEKAIRLLNWLSKNTFHNGGMMGNYQGDFEALSLLERSFQTDQEHGLNCVFLSFVLSSLYLSLGMKAFPIWMMPYSPYDSDNHVVVNVYVSDQKKWIMVDPSFGAYFTNEDSVILNTLELREELSLQKKPKLNPEFSYNNTPNEEIKGMIEYYYSYMAKNSYSFIVNKEIVMKNMYDTNSRYIVPRYYNPKKRELENLEFRVREYGENEWTQDRRRNLRSRKFTLTSFENVYRLDEK